VDRCYRVPGGSASRLHKQLAIGMVGQGGLGSPSESRWEVELCLTSMLGGETFWGIEDLPDLTHQFVAGEGLLKKRIVRSQHVVASVCVIRIA
jgi:hypothetical protein